ncbi:MAG: GTP-binding protein [Clostridia bacterium]|nr:GTP-binding protein [Clostridia bacterium]
MVKITVVSGFLGAGKTTLIKKLISEVYEGEKIALIENEFGEIGIDGGFLKNAGIEIKEMNSGCICCSLVGDFGESLKELKETYRPERIIIEPTGVGKLSDVLGAIENLDDEEMVLDCAITVVDGTKCKMYSKNFGEFYNNQIETATCLLMTRMDKITEEKLSESLEILKGINPDASVITTPLCELKKENILSAIKGKEELLEEMLHHYHEHHHEHGEDCDCGCHDHHHEHHHEHGEDCDCGCHEHHHEHHHEHDEDCDCGCHDHHEHHHEHDEHCDCGCHEHHHGHHADEAFSSWGIETPKTFSKTALEGILKALDSGDYGTVLRAKGIVKGEDGWLAFDFVPEETEIRESGADYTGRICVIGAELNEDALSKLFEI